MNIEKFNLPFYYYNIIDISSLTIDSYNILMEWTIPENYYGIITYFEFNFIDNFIIFESGNVIDLFTIDLKVNNISVFGYDNLIKKGYTIKTLSYFKDDNAFIYIPTNSLVQWTSNVKSYCNISYGKFLYIITKGYYIKEN